MILTALFGLMKKRFVKITYKTMTIKTYTIEDKTDAALMMYIETKCSERHMLTFVEKGIVKIDDTLHIHDPYKLLDR